jgi:hypothetical protein
MDGLSGLGADGHAGVSSQAKSVASNASNSSQKPLLSPNTDFSSLPVAQRKVRGSTAWNDVDTKGTSLCVCHAQAHMHVTMWAYVSAICRQHVSMSEEEVDTYTLFWMCMHMRKHAIIRVNTRTYTLIFKSIQAWFGTFFEKVQ